MEFEARLLCHSLTALGQAVLFSRRKTPSMPGELLIFSMRKYVPIHRASLSLKLEPLSQVSGFLSK